jgi:hypothetical protein
MESISVFSSSKSTGGCTIFKIFLIFLMHESHHTWVSYCASLNLPLCSSTVIVAIFLLAVVAASSVFSRLFDF